MTFFEFVNLYLGVKYMEQFGRYIVQEEIGRGGMGIVYRAYDPDIDRNIALKALRPERSSDWDLIRRFLREAKAAGRLTHPNIVTVYDVGEDKGTAFIAMELLVGCPLNQLIQQGPLPLEKSIHYAKQIALALQYAHIEGVVHRDVKPSNIIVVEGDTIKITDFGVARIQDMSLTEETRTGQILGTPNYMAPEQVMGKKVDGRADLFSLGVILYEMLSGGKPFKGDNFAALFHSILKQSQKPLKEISPDVPSEIDSVVSKALEKDLDKRYQTGKEFAEALSVPISGGSVSVSSKSVVNEDVKERQRTKSLGAKFVYVALAALIILGIFMIPRAFRHDSQDLRRNKEVRETTDTGKNAARVEKGTLDFRSKPFGAEVLLNGQIKGKTPLTLGLDAGSYEVKLKLPGYLTWEAQVNVKKKQVIPLDVTLIPAGKQDQKTATQ